MEWMYAFDIHCNSFFPVFVLLHTIHYFLLPLLIESTYLGTFMSNMLYAVAFCYYSYITSLGYSVLPFLENTDVFLYPSVIVLAHSHVVFRENQSHTNFVYS